MATSLQSASKTNRQPRELIAKGERWDPLPIELIKPEIYAPGKFVFKQPMYCNAQRKSEYLSPPSKTYVMAVHRLSHFCHVEDALRITQDNTKVKSPAIILGSPCHLRQNVMPVMSGYDSCIYYGDEGPQPLSLYDHENQWCFFDVEVTDDNRSQLITECSDEDKELIQLPTFQSPYLANCSSQGEIRFSSDVRNVLESYILSRGVLTGLVFLCGGSLLYSDEIAHIVVVCCRDDPIVNFFPDLPENSPFIPNNILKSDHDSAEGQGKIHLSYIKKTGREAIWDHVVLAFFLPEGQGIVLEGGQYECGIGVHQQCATRPINCPEVSTDPFKSISKSRNLSKVVKIVTSEVERKKLKKW